jgi:two-component system, LytTR family, response regulator
MRKYNAIIIDDEPNVRQGLEVMVQQNCPEIQLCGVGASAEAGRRLLKEMDVHLIFLDISMPKESGFDFIASIPKENYAIIFTTAFQEYALKAIKASAIDYLLKPINPVELKEAVTKAISYLNLRLHKNEARKVYSESLDNLSQQIKNKGNQIKKITVAEQFGFRIIEVKLIRYLEADSNYTILHLSGLEKIVTSKALGEFEKILDPPGFFRIHKSTIINMDFLKSYSGYQGHFAVLDDNTKLAISRRRINEFKEAVNLFSKSLD